MERTKYNNNGELLFIFNFANPILACLCINGKIYIAYPNPSPLLLTLTLESRTLSKSLNNIFLRYSVVSLSKYLLVLSPLTLL